MNSYPKTYYWLIPIGILSGLLTCMIAYFAIKSDIGVLLILGGMLPGLVLTFFNTLIFIRTKQIKYSVLKTSILGGLLTFLIYIASVLVVLPFVKLTEEFIAVGIMGIVIAVIARLFFAIQFQVPTKPLSIITFCITGFCTGMMVDIMFSIDFLRIEILPALRLNFILSYTLFTTLFNTCILLAFAQKKL